MLKSLAGRTAADDLDRRQNVDEGTEAHETAGRPVLVPLACLLAGGALLGVSTNLAKLAGEAGLPPLAFLTWSIIGATGVLFAVAALRRDLPSVTRRTIEYFIVSAFVGVAASNLIFFAAVPKVGASFVALVIAFPPLLTYLGALALRVEAFDRLRAMGVALALGGAAYIAMRKLQAPDANALWIGLALFGPVLLAIGNLYRTLRWPKGESVDALAPGMLLAASAMLLAAGTLPGFSLAVPGDSLAPLALIAAQVAVFSGSYLLLFALQKHGGPVYLSLLGAVGAVCGVPIAVLLLGEAPPEGLLLGGSLIAGGVALLTLGGAKGQSGPVENS